MNADAPAFIPSFAGTSSANTSDPAKTPPTSNRSHRQRSQPRQGASKPPPEKRAPKDRSKKREDAPLRENNNPRTRSSAHQREQTSTIANGFQQMNLVEIAQQTGGATDKKGRVSLNHLLNFSFPQRQAPQHSYTPRKVRSTSYQPYNKERFVNANFRFLVNACGDYTVNMADPDANFDWDKIEQVLISAAETPSCPICLSPPTAARVTKCGHIFCLPCILHYLELRENPRKLWRKCPICWDAIYERDLKSVRIQHPYAVANPQGNSFTGSVSEGDHVEMCLIQRAAHSTLAFPISDTWPVPADILRQYLDANAALNPWHFTPNAMQFAKFMLTSPDYIETEYKRDRRELLDAANDATSWGSTEEMPYIERSIEQVDSKLKDTNEQRSKEMELAMQTSRNIFHDVTDRSVAGKNRTLVASKKEIISQPADDVEIPEAYRQLHLRLDQDKVNNESSSVRQETKTSTPKKPADAKRLDETALHDFYFFQAVDGQHLYLHPLDIRILKYEYTDYPSFPRQLNITVTGVEETTVTEDLRKRFKYLSHLPLACDVTFLEAEMKDIVSEKTLKAFSHELKMRAKKRQDRVKREEKIRRAAEAKQRKQTQSVPRYDEEQIRNDPFFAAYRPMSAEENEAMMNRALEESAAAAMADNALLPSSDPVGKESSSNPKTVWGTPAVPSAAEILQQESNEWADHIIVTKKTKKKKGKRS
ncbi:uncharacterized protein BYT42DRAFT_587850 [Radiomyces spectabilis]|uniref:uncharacterized protein n=1 Tax=Radiomyces spectabilis TaxID=64574 RepID=UPI00222002A3|nr:uncharacterized protein BYT42DRAFT_587850 [Radiomyces spectabilis]KAI8366779.1 hypothetical protein BYT42DRAFT_587850 [Radiomyces spectabilis]